MPSIVPQREVAGERGHAPVDQMRRRLRPRRLRTDNPACSARRDGAQHRAGVETSSPGDRRTPAALASAPWAEAAASMTPSAPASTVPSTIRPHAQARVVKASLVQQARHRGAAILGIPAPGDAMSPALPGNAAEDACQQGAAVDARCSFPARPPSACRPWSARSGRTRPPCRGRPAPRRPRRFRPWRASISR